MLENPTNLPLTIGSLIFPGMDQLDFTGPFEVLSRLPKTTVHVLWKELTPIRDTRGLVLTPTMKLSEAPELDVLHISGGFGQEELMEDQEVLSFIRQRAARAKFVFSVCTGALLLGAAGLLKGRRATTHWASFNLLEYFGATAVDVRTVLDGNLLTTAGVTAGIDGALRLAALLRGDIVAQTIQLEMEYAPEPPFHSGEPERAPAIVFRNAEHAYKEIHHTRLATAKRYAERLGVKLDNQR